MPIKQNTLNIGHKDQVSDIIGPVVATVSTKPSTQQASFAPKNTPPIITPTKPTAPKAEAVPAESDTEQQQQPQS